MKSLIAVLAFVCLSANASAATPNAVLKAAANLKSKDVRTVVRTVENKDGNPCMPEGKSYEVDLQVKMPLMTENKGVQYTWETVKTIGVDLDGGVMEICAE